LKKKEREEADKFDAEMEAIYDEAKKAKAFYTLANLKAEISITKEAQKHVISEIQLAQQETKEAVAKLQLKDNGKPAVFLLNNFAIVASETTLVGLLYSTASHHGIGLDEKYSTSVSSDALSTVS